MQDCIFVAVIFSILHLSETPLLQNCSRDMRKHSRSKITDDMHLGINFLALFWKIVHLI